MSKGIYILLGSNLGSREENLTLATAKITEQVGRILAQSSLYQSEPWGITQQPEFLNQVIEINSRNDPHQVLQKLLAIETEMGRERLEKWGPRIIDLDLLYCMKCWNCKVPAKPFLYQVLILLEAFLLAKGRC